MGVGVGDEIIIDLPDVGETRWTIVGLVFDLNGRDQNTAFANINTLNLALHNVGRASVAMVQGTDQSLATQQAIEADLIDFFDANRMEIGYSAVATEDRDNASAQFSILTQLLMMMTVLMAIVGSMGLSGTLSINVIERRREIGVMRAVGASSRDVGFVFTGESLMLGLTSWKGHRLSCSILPCHPRRLDLARDRHLTFDPRQLGPVPPRHPRQCQREPGLRIAGRHAMLRALSPFYALCAVPLRTHSRHFGAFLGAH
jgi:hypothetical protein